MGVNLHGPVKPPTQLSLKLITSSSLRIESWLDQTPLYMPFLHLLQITALCS
jgi:hypothetical protein